MCKRNGGGVGDDRGGALLVWVGCSFDLGDGELLSHASAHSFVWAHVNRELREGAVNTTRLGMLVLHDAVRVRGMTMMMSDLQDAHDSVTAVRRRQFPLESTELTGKRRTYEFHSESAFGRSVLVPFPLACLKPTFTGSSS